MQESKGNVENPPRPQGRLLIEWRSNSFFLPWYGFEEF
jgi:hypothetical protein